MATQDLTQIAREIVNNYSSANWAAVLATFLVHPDNRVQAADCQCLLNGREPAKVSEISGLGPWTREEIRMLSRWVRTLTSTVECSGHRVGQIIKTLLRPVPPRPHSPAPPPSTPFGRARNWWPRTHCCDSRFSCWLERPRRVRACSGRTASSWCCSPASTPRGATPFISSNPIPSCAGIAISSPSSGDAAPHGLIGPEGWARRSSS